VLCISTNCIHYVSQYELLRDYKALNTLRELLVIIRIWGLLRQSCLPVFVRSAENLDVLALLFKLLSRLIQTSEADENLLGNLSLVVEVAQCVTAKSSYFLVSMKTLTPQYTLGTQV